MTSHNPKNLQPPTAAFIGSSWAVLVIGILAYLFGIYNAQMMLNEKGYYVAVLAFALYAAISLQKVIRDRLEDIPTTNLYYMISWTALILAVILELVGLWNASLSMSEKGFYLMAFTMTIFAAITVQKNVRDLQQFSKLFAANTPNQINNPSVSNQAHANSEERQHILQSPFRRKKED